jgi:uncharacterized membrane protein
MDQEKNKTKQEEAATPANPLDNFEPNVIAAFAYLFPFITGVAFFLMEKENKFVKFHAVQSVMFWLAVVILGSFVDVFQQLIYIVGYLFGTVLKIGTLSLWLYLMWKAYNKTEFELPYLGKMAKDFVNKQ